MSKEIQNYNIPSLPKSREDITNRNSVDKLLSDINNLDNIVLSFDNADEVKESKKFKTNANKFIKEFKKFCEPLEEEGRKIAKTRSEVKLTLERIVNSKLQPITLAEAELKKLEETSIATLDIYSIDVKLKELDNLLQFNWLAYKEEALGLINSLKNMALLRKEALEKEEEEIIKRAEQERKEREEEIAKNAANNARIEAENRIKREQEQKELQTKRLKEEEEKKTNDVEHKRKVHNEILEAISVLDDITSVDNAKSLICKIAKGEIPNLYIKY